MIKFLLLVITIVASNFAYSQCAPGIPGAGNPGCIPPDVPGSPGGQYRDVRSTSTPIWSDRWGAISYDNQKDLISVTDTMKSEQEAIGAVIDDCRKKGGNNCALIFAYHNQCAAIVSTNDRIGFGRGPQKSDAEKMARKDCGKVGKCEVIYSKCSDPVRVQ